MSTQTKSTLKLLLVIIGMSMYVLLLLCYLSTDSVIIETMFLSSCLVLALSIVVSYFRSTMMYDDNYTNTPDDVEQFILLNTNPNTQQDEDTVHY